MTDRRGWLTVTMPHDVMQPGEVIHVVPVDGPDTAVPANGHEFHIMCWCHPRRVTGPLDEGVVLSHNEPGWPGSNDDPVMGH